MRACRESQRLLYRGEAHTHIRIALTVSQEREEVCTHRQALELLAAEPRQQLLAVNAATAVRVEAPEESLERRHAHILLAERMHHGEQLRRAERPVAVRVEVLEHCGSGGRGRRGRR